MLCTCGKRTMAVRTPRAVSATTASSEAARGNTFGLRGGSLSVDGVPGAAACAVAVPEVTMNGLRIAGEDAAHLRR